MIRTTATGYSYETHKGTDHAEVGDYFCALYEEVPGEGSVCTDTYLIESSLEDLQAAARLAKEDGYKPDDTCTLVLDDTPGDGRTEDYPFTS